MSFEERLKKRRLSEKAEGQKLAGARDLLSSRIIENEQAEQEKREMEVASFETFCKERLLPIFQQLQEHYVGVDGSVLIYAAASTHQQIADRNPERYSPEMLKSEITMHYPKTSENIVFIIELLWDSQEQYFSDEYMGWAYEKRIRIEVAKNVVEIDGSDKVLARDANQITTLSTTRQKIFSILPNTMIWKEIVTLHDSDWREKVEAYILKTISS